MAFCKFCGRPVSDGEICNCQSEVPIPGNTVQPEADAQPNPFNFSELGGAAAQEKKHSKKTIIIGAAIVIGVILAAVIVILCVFCNKDDDKKKKETAKNAAKKYVLAYSNPKRGEEYYNYILPNDAVKQLKKNDDWDYYILTHKNNYEDYSNIKVELVNQQEKMNKKQLEYAEEYIEDLYDEYDLNYRKKLKITEGYSFIAQYRYEYLDEGDTCIDTNLLRFCVLKIDNEGWKIIECPIDRLEYYYE